MDDPLINLAPDLWVANRGFVNELGAITSRMTAIRLSNGRLLIHSPVPLEAALRAAVEDLGPVTALLAPNLYHHLFIAEWKSAFPKARVFGVAGLAAKCRNINFDAELGAGSPNDWADEVDQLAIGGVPSYGDVVFFHRASRTLLVSDLVFNYTPAQAAQDPGAADGLGPHRRVRVATTDASALRESVDRILQWPFDRVVVGHGDVVETGGHARFRDGFAYLRAI